MTTEEKSIEEELSFPILLGERVLKAIGEADSSKQECAEVAKHVDKLTQMLRSAIRIASSTPFLYERPVRCIVADVAKSLDRALTLVRKCKRGGGLLRRVVNITNLADFRKLFAALDASVGDTKWLLTVLTGEEGIVTTLPPIANTDPILSYVWSYLAVVSMASSSPPDRIDAANSLASLALDNDRNKKIILEEEGVPPLLKLLKEATLPDGQIAAATVLANLATDRNRVCQIAYQLAVPIIVKVLNDSPMRVQIQVALLVSKMAGLDPDSQEEFGRENVIRPLVSLLSFETFSLDDPKPAKNSNVKTSNSIHSLVQILPSQLRNSNLSHHHLAEGSSSRGHGHRKERENESPDVKLKLKISCAEALRMLSKGSVTNSRRITDTKGLLCLAKIVEKESGELQLNCLMTVMEIAKTAELNADLRRSALKTTSPAAKAVVDQLLRVVREEGRSGNTTLLIPAIQSIGSLARTFPVRETRVIGPLVNQLGHMNPDVAAEAAAALGKFACPENFNCVEHSKAIIESDGVPPLMRLLRSTEMAQLHGLILLCYLALHVGKSEALERARALTALELASRSLAAQHPDLKELLPRAMYHLELYQAGVHPHRQSYVP